MSWLASDAPSAEKRSWAMLAQLAAFAGLILPLAGQILGPRVIWLVRREHSPFVATQAKEAVNFNISVVLGWVICGLLGLVFVGFLLGIVLLILWIVATITTAIKAGEGLDYRYPVTLRLVR